MPRPSGSPVGKDIDLIKISDQGSTRRLDFRPPEHAWLRVAVVGSGLGWLLCSGSYSQVPSGHVSQFCCALPGTQPDSRPAVGGERDVGDEP
jgi:hypothetical protein